MGGREGGIEQLCKKLKYFSTGCKMMVYGVVSVNNVNVCNDKCRQCHVVTVLPFIFIFKYNSQLTPPNLAWPGETECDCLSQFLHFI